MNKEHNDASGSSYSPCLERWRERWSAAGWLLVPRWPGCTGSPAPGLCRAWAAQPAPRASQCNRNLCHAQCPHAALLPGAGLSRWLSPPASGPWGDTYCHKPPPSCSFPPDPNPHHIHPPLPAAKAQAALPSLASSCITNRSLEVLNKTAARSQTLSKKRKGARKGWRHVCFRVCE